MMKQKPLAEESSKTKKSRAKLKKQLDALDQHITSQALERKTIEIHRWIERHSSQRVILKAKSICLFDENQNTADVSQRIIQLVEQLKNTQQKTSCD